MHKVLVFTATYNEAANIGPWIEGVAQAIPSADILIIDDSSPDHTANVITESVFFSIWSCPITLTGVVPSCYALSLGLSAPLTSSPETNWMLLGL